MESTNFTENQPINVLTNVRYVMSAELTQHTDCIVISLMLKTNANSSAGK